MSVVEGLFAPMACVFACLAGYCAAYGVRDARQTRARTRAARKNAGVAESAGAGRDMQAAVIAYAARVTRAIDAHIERPLSLSVRSGRAERSQAARFVGEHCLAAGCEGELSANGFCETRFRLCVAGALAGALAGCMFSMELALVGAVVLGFLGWLALRRALLETERKRALLAGAHISEMLEVVALGLRSGLTFDKSFYLYSTHFDSGFAKDCACAYERWSMGLATREESLRRLSSSYACEELDRAIETIVRSLRFGSSFASSLEEIAAASRASYRTRLEERVAKAPVKMMLPTGALILPAMLLLVMGPILLELGQGL